MPYAAFADRVNNVNTIYAADINGMNDYLGAATKGVFSVREYGAAGNGVADDTAAIRNAISAAASNGGGTVLFAPGTYLVSGSLTLTSGVRLVGVSGMLGAASGDTLVGAVIKTTGTGYDVVTTSSSTLVKGIAIEHLTFYDCVNASNWAIHIYGLTGGIFRDVAVLYDSYAGGNAIWLDGGNQGVYQACVEDCSVTSGGGFLGGTGLRLGNSGNPNSVANANNVVMFQTIGMATGIYDDQGGGNTFIAPWCQSCTTGLLLNSAALAVYGGWMEANTTAVTFGALSNHCTVIGTRTTGNTTILNVVAGSAGCRMLGVNGYNPVGAFASQPTLPASTVAYTNNLGTDAMVCITGGTVTAIAIGGTATGLTSGSFRVPAGQTVAVTYSSPPSWKWMGD